MRVEERFTDIAAIVVCHNSPATLAATVRALQNAGLSARAILVVDNSDQAEPAAAVRASADVEFTLLHTPNRGYGAAVNDGLAYLSRQGPAREFTVVSTHESIAAPDAVSLLRSALLADSCIAVAGPTLINAGSRDESIWSTGGMLTKVLKRPQHHRRDFPAETNGAMNGAMKSAIDRDWLDGAFALYRTPLLSGFGIDETFFLYFEETDLHTRLGGAGFRIVWVPAAQVSQRSSGIPPRLLGRNLFLFHARHFSRTRGRLAVGYEAARALARAALTSRGRWSAAGEILRGWIQGEAIVRGTDFTCPGSAKIPDSPVWNSNG